ncbi:MAG: hypothetical protein V4710_03010 [Verrucomicrobiota bacterium]
MQNVTIIREINCHRSVPSAIDRIRLAVGMTASVSCRTRASVWLAFAPYEPDNDEHDYTLMATRIIGPLPTAQAEAVIRQLQTAFQSGGFQVLTEIVADD